MLIVNTIYQVTMLGTVLVTLGLFPIITIALQMTELMFKEVK